MFYINQQTNHDCGFTCLKIMLANLNHQKDYLFLINKKDKYSYYDLIEIAKEHQLILEGVEFKNPKDLLNTNKMMIITIKEDGLNHAVIIKKVRKTKFIIIDPNKGKSTISYEDLILKWDKTALIIKSFKKNKFKAKKVVEIKNYQMAIYLSLKIISGLSLITGLSFVKDGEFVFLPILLSAVAVILEMLSRNYSFYMLKNNDERVYGLIEKIPKDKEDFINNYENTKMLYFSNLNGLLVKSLTALFIIILMIYNGAYNIFLAGIALVMCVINHFLFNPLIEKKMSDIESMNKDILDQKDKTGFVNSLRIAHIESYKYGNYLLFQKLITYFIVLLTIILIMILSNVVSVSYLILYFTFTIYLVENINYLFDYKNNERKFDLYKLKTLYSIS
ncbi:MAG: cysteine peptidase family C39 domain-containing protein [Bacilli bacterium]